MEPDYCEFPCKCGGVIDVYIDWNNGDEYAKCRNDCEQFTNEWHAEEYNKNKTR